MKTTSEYIELLKQYKESNADKYGIAKIGIFGSVARGMQNKNSDVDIYMVSKPLSLFTMVRIKGELQELLGCSVDIVRLRDRMNSLLRKRIEEEGIYA